ncbi:hypothetical protein FE254_20570 [Ectopseudomonas guguanensis]|nr:hypothetical protein FE254_20570 [Pseudomonas guguanensis]
MTQTRRRFPESFKREAVDQVLAGTARTTTRPCFGTIASWPSHSRPGNCWDNAAMGSFFRSLKAERVYLTRYASYQEAKTDLFDYIRFLQSPPTPLDVGLSQSDGI